MDAKTKREKLANELHMLADAIMDDESVGKVNDENNELKIESSLGGQSSVTIIVKNFISYQEVLAEDEWPELIGE